MIGCDRERISAYYDGALPPAERRLVERHLSRCQRCRDVLESYRELGLGIRSMPDHAPPAIIRARVFSRIPSANKPRELRRRRSVLSPAPIAAAAAVLVIALITYPRIAGQTNAPAQVGQPAGQIAAATTARQAQPAASPARPSEPTEEPRTAVQITPATDPEPTTAPPDTLAAEPTSVPMAAGTTVPTIQAAETTPAPADPTATVATSNPTSVPATPASIATAAPMASPTSSGIRLLGDPPLPIATPSPTTMTGTVLEVDNDEIVTQSDDGARWRVSLSSIEGLAQLDGLALSITDLQPGVRINIIGRSTGLIRELITNESPAPTTSPQP